MLEQEGERRRLETFSLGETFPTERDRSRFFKCTLYLLFVLACSKKKKKKKFLHTLDRNTTRIPYIQRKREIKRTKRSFVVFSLRPVHIYIININGSR